MRRRTLQRAATRLTAALAIVAIATAQLMLSLCQCGLAVQAAGIDERAPACCCASSCSQPAMEAPACCCSPTDCSTGDDGGCGCSAPSQEFPVQAPSSPVQSDNVLASSALLPFIAVAANCGLNGAPWSTAFDLASPGSPPGIRLHALLSVWRN